MGKPWTLEQAIDHVSIMRDLLRAVGFEVGMCGSVLFEGKSENDLDVIVFPTRRRLEGFTVRVDQTPAYEAIVQKLAKIGMMRTYTRDAVQARWRKLGSDDTKHVEVWHCPDGRRVDLFFLQ